MSNQDVPSLKVQRHSAQRQGIGQPRGIPDRSTGKTIARPPVSSRFNQIRSLRLLWFQRTRPPRTVWTYLAFLGAGATCHIRNCDRRNQVLTSLLLTLNATSEDISSIDSGVVRACLEL